MEPIPHRDGRYETPSRRIGLLAKLKPSLPFYAKMARIVFTSSRQAKRGQYPTARWAESSRDILTALESVGVRVEITGLDNITAVKGPCVFIGNHMSTLETFVLPCIIAPLKDATFVVKQSLVDYPVFRYVMRSRNPVTVGRTNPREDLKAVLEGGAERLREGRSMIIFPQSTRSEAFDPAEFNTIGIKLAKKAGVPVIPIAMKTNAWGNGRRLKDFGRIDPSKTVHIAFGSPMNIRDRGTEEHEEIISFIQQKLREWA